MSADPLRDLSGVKLCPGLDIQFNDASLVFNPLPRVATIC